MSALGIGSYCASDSLSYQHEYHDKLCSRSNFIPLAPE
jgi:hypothetical protein